MTTLDARAEAESLSSIQRVIYETTDTLTSESIVKMIFLFSDLVNEKELQSLLNTSVANCNRMFCLVKVVLGRKQLAHTLGINIWAELLYLTKNYRLLRKLNTCKHKMKEKMLRGTQFFSSTFRRYLVSCADEMTDEEVQHIWSKVEKSNTDFPDQPELLFLHLLKERLISEENLKELQFYFGFLGRSDLQSKTEQYLEKAGILLGKSAHYDLELDCATGYCGQALIFNNKTFNKQPPPEYESIAEKSLSIRDGTDIDAERLDNLWKSFGIRSCIYPDTDIVELQTHLNDCLNSDLPSVKILVVCILTHGSEGEVFCADGVPVEIAEIEELLTTSEKLARKPKLLFIQACQGTAVQKKGRSSIIAEKLEFDATSSNAEKMPVPMFSDLLTGISTVSGFRSMRSKTEGSYFIQTLADVLEMKGDKEDLSSLITDINGIVSSKWVPYNHNKENLELVQVPTFRNQLNKRLTFTRNKK